MASVRYLLSAFLGGEVDPLLSGRVETDQHALGLSLCENFVCVNEGPLVKRPGFHYVCDAAATASWLGAFRFSITQEYLIEWSAAKARFYTNEARIETSPGVAYEVATPYAAADAPRLSTQQSYDRLYIDHGSYPPAALARTGATTFSHANTVLNNGPFLDTNTDETVTVTVSGALTVGGAVTVTASSAIFAAGQVGGQLRIEAKDFSTIKAWEPGMGESTGTKVAIGDVVRSEGKAYKALTAGVTGSKVPVHERGAEWDGLNLKDAINAKGPYGVQWEYLHDRYGIVQITGFTSATQVTGTVKRRLPDSVASVATFRWAQSAFSNALGWPAIVLHGFGRQIHVKDFDVIGSVVGDYGGGQCNFDSTTSSGTTEADLGFRRRLAESNPPIWGLFDKRLQLGTAEIELAIGALNQAAALSGSNIEAERQSFYGSEPVWPVQLGTETIFVERGGRRIRSITYDLGQERYVPSDLTKGCGHITGPGIVQLTAQRAPYALLQAVRGDGQIAVHALNAGELKGFSRTVLGGDARAISGMSIVGSDGKTDQLWLLVERERHDGTKREIWRQADWRRIGDAQAEQFFVDGGRIVTVIGGTTTITGATHLAGQDIAVLLNGAVVPGIEVANDGTFELPAEVVPASNYTLVYGLGYTAKAVTLRPELKLRSGTIQGLKKRVRKAVLRLLETMSIAVGAVIRNTDGSEEDRELEELIDRPASAAMDAPVPLYTGDTEGPIETDYDTEGRVRFVSDAPLNAVITAAVLSLEVDEQDA